LSLVFFTDRDLGTLFPAILKGAGFTVERHRDHFPPECPDEDWLAEVGRREWVAVTHDARIRYKPNELAAVASFVATRSRIEDFLDGASAPMIAKVYRATPADLTADPGAAGRIDRWYPK